MRTSPLALAFLGICAMLTFAPAAGAHTVLAGETLSGIAAANGLSTQALATANGMNPDAWVIEGTTLNVPAPGTVPTAPATPVPSASPSGTPLGGHLVVKGETLSGIAAANGLSTQALAAANGMSPDAFVIADTRLRIPAPGTGTTTVAPRTTSTSSTSVGDFRVRLGDTLSGIAAEHGIALATLAAENDIDPDAPLIAGTYLRLSGSGPAPASPTSAAGPVPTPGRLTAAEISSIAAQHGVPGSLAAAIAWQESGFNNAMVSPANARGIMQVLPSTWDFVQSSLSPTRLDPSSATDNVRAGSLLLGYLLRNTGGDPALAAAGYYQGLASVRKIGMLPTTRQYVDNVLALRSRFGG